MKKRKIKSRNTPVGRMIKMGATNLVGVGMIGATASMVNTLPTGTAKTIAGIAPGLQSIALVGSNLKMMKPKGKKKSEFF